LLARHCELHLFLLNPCREFWGDIRSERDIARYMTGVAREIDPAEEYLEVGNPLLASLGKQGRDFFDLLENQNPDIRDYFTDPPGDRLLDHLQADILNLCQRGDDPQARLAVTADDRSVQLHVCHSPTRELEVLHDQLLALFQAHPDLRPSDVIVMTPDIEAYGPLIEAVFGSVPRSRFIPYSIADRGPGAERPLVEAVQQLIELGRGRYPVDRVLGFLEQAAVRRRFGLDTADLALIRDWLRQTRIRWGVDAADRRVGFNLPATDEHSWRAGLERLLLGHALPGGGRRLWADILPYDAIEGSAALVLGRLQAFAEGLFTLREEVARDRSPGDWAVVMRDWLDRFFAPPETQSGELQEVRAALDRLVSLAAQAGFEQPVPLSVMRTALNRVLVEQAGSGGFFAGGVTFATMVPMRSIPFEVVCLIGMNHGSYPRPHRSADFDLMSSRYRKGDRSRRQDDRYLFLEALLSARRYFYLSHVGRDVRDNSVLPPSVLISELLDVIERGFAPADGYTTIRMQLIVEHPLQPFSRHYFAGDNPALFSYSEELAELGCRAAGERVEVKPFLDAPLPPPDELYSTLSPEQLVRFFEHPARFLLREHLGVQLDMDESALEGREPFVLDGLERYGLYQRLLDWQLEDLDRDQAHRLARAEGLLPHGQVGVNLFEREWSGMRRFAARVRRLLGSEARDPVEIDHVVNELRLQGRLDRLTEAGLIGYRPATIKSKDRLRLWLRHLLLNLRRPDGVEPVSRWLGLDGEVQLSPVSDAESRLGELVRLYRRGLCEPLPLFERSSWAYAERLHAGKSSNEALKAARTTWEGNDFSPGEFRQDAYLALAFRGREDPLDETFTALAEQFWEPFFAHARDDTAISD
jgi:exodeoxyribonuclease V gamma subunit